MRRKWVVLMVALAGAGLLAVFAGRAILAPYREKLPNGVVDWDAGWIRADVSVPIRRGIPAAQALVEARRVAVIKAQAAALRIAMRIPVNSEKRLESFQALKIKVKGIVAGGEVVSEKRVGGRYDLSLKVPINGVKGIAAEVATVILPPPSPTKPVTHRGKASSLSTGASAAGSPPNASRPSLASFASVTVDAREAGVKPALEARILDPEGREIYGPSTVKPEIARTRSLARYATMERKTASGAGTPWFYTEKPGILPLALIRPPGFLMAQIRTTGRKRGRNQGYFLQAASASGRLKADIVVTRETARKLREIEARTGALSDGKVIIVVRADVGGVESRILSHGAGKPVHLASR